MILLFFIVLKLCIYVSRKNFFKKKKNVSRKIIYVHPLPIIHQDIESDIYEGFRHNHKLNYLGAHTIKKKLKEN